jgi:Protein of unknown function (DUF1569)
MENIFQPTASAAILQRLEKLQPGTPPQWGKMNPAQMLAHCQVPLQVALGEKDLKQSFMGVLFGRIAKKQMLKDAPIKKNLPTDPSFLVKDQRSFENEKKLLVSAIQRFGAIDKTLLAQKRHPFFGYMSAEEWGLLMWKHLDHHLRQFGV